MARLFKRSCIFRFGKNGILDTEIKELRMQFKVERNLETNPNTGEIKIYNLNQSNRDKLSSEGAICTFDAGYAGNEKHLLQGTIARVSHIKQGPDWITSIELGDGEKALKTATVDKTFTAGATGQDVISEVVGVLKRIKDGGIESVKNLAAGLVKNFTSGITISGSATDILKSLGETMGFESSVQDGELVLLPKNTVGTQTAVDLSPSTGLVGSPAPLKQEDKAKQPRTGVTVRSLLQPDVIPGRLFVLQDTSISGSFRAEKVTHEGDSREGPFYSSLEGFEI